MELKLPPRVQTALEVAAIILMGLLFVATILGVLWGYDTGAKAKVEARGLTVTSMSMQPWGCMGKGRVAYRFTTVEKRSGKICYGGFPATITFDDE